MPLRFLRRPTPPTTLRRRLTLALALMSVVPALLITGLVVARGVAQRQEAVTRRLGETAVAVCRATDAYVYAHVVALRDHTADHASLDGADALPRIGAGLGRFHQSYQGFRSLITADATGRVVAVHSPLPETGLLGADVADRAYFRIPMSSGLPFVSNGFVGRALDGDPIVAVAVPLLDARGVPLGIVEGSFDLEAIGRFADSFGGAGPHGATLEILDGEGQLVHASAGALAPLTPRRDEAFVRALLRRERAPAAGAASAGGPLLVDGGAIVQLTALGTSDAGVHAVSAQAVAAGAAGASCRTTFGWLVVARLPVAYLWYEQRAALLGALALTLVVAVLSLVAARQLARRIADPMRQLSDAADAVLADHSDDAARLLRGVAAHPTAPREVVALAQHLDAMHAHVGRSDAALRGALDAREAEVRARTAELTAAVGTLAAREGELRALFAAMRDVVLVLDGDGRYVRVMRTAPELLVRPAAELEGRTLHDVMPAEAADACLAHVRHVLASGEATSLEYELLLHGSGPTAFAATISPVGDGTVLWVARDVTAQKRAEAALRELSTRDELTGLLNRRGLRPLAEQALLIGRRTLRRDALLYVDLDRFKAINDTHGHAAGDEALGIAARLLRDTVREGDLVARFGGDEFVVLAVGITNEREGRVLAARITAAFETHSARATAAGRPWTLACTIGVAESDPGDDLDLLLARADAALYSRKAARR